jgi:hypothetical protein
MLFQTDSDYHQAESLQQKRINMVSPKLVHYSKAEAIMMFTSSWFYRCFVKRKLLLIQIRWFLNVDLHVSLRDDKASSPISIGTDASYDSKSESS